MARLHLIVEGPTEQAFAAQLLIPCLATKGVFLSNPQLAAHARKKGRVHRGGILSYLPFKNDIIRRLKEDRSSDVFLSTMVDLYGLPKDFPGTEKLDSQCDPYQHVKHLEDELAEDIGDARFLPYIQLHEFEALLLAMPDAFLPYCGDWEKEIEELNILVAKFDSPEKINDGENTAPSKRIIAKIPDYGKAKPTLGPLIAERIGLEIIRSKCPHFDRWLQKLENLNS